MSLKEDAYRIIKTNILSCQFPPNEFIDEKLLIEKYQMSRTPIREALSSLEREKLVKIYPKKGILVLGLTLSDVNQTFEVRMLIEPYILENYLDLVDREKLDALENETQGLLSDEHASASDFTKLDDRFHRSLSEACTNDYLTDILNRVYDQNERIRHLSGPAIWERHKDAAREHLEIIHYIKEKQPEEVKAALKYHIIKSREAALQALTGRSIPV